MKILIRIPTAPPSKRHKDKKKYNRKLKHRRENERLHTRY